MTGTKKTSSTEPEKTTLYYQEARPIRRLHPLGFRVVAKLVKDSNKTDSGLYLPEGSKESMKESLLAEVIEVASTVDSHTDEETNVSGIPLGSLVLIPKNAGTTVPWDESLRIVDTGDVLAIVDEITLT
jgi:co-chaperonin GroES (HSP10)